MKANHSDSAIVAVILPQLLTKYIQTSPGSCLSYIIIAPDHFCHRDPSQSLNKILKLFTNSCHCFEEPLHKGVYAL